MSLFDINEKNIENSFSRYLAVIFGLSGALGFFIYLLLLKAIFVINTPLPKVVFIVTITVTGLSIVVILLTCKLDLHSEHSIGKKLVHMAVFATFLIAVFSMIYMYILGIVSLFEIINIRIILVLFLMFLSVTLTAGLYLILVKRIIKKIGYVKALYLPASYYLLPLVMTAATFSIMLINGINYRQQTKFNEEYLALNNIAQSSSVAQSINYEIFTIISKIQSIEKMFAFYILNANDRTVQEYSRTIANYFIDSGYTDSELFYSFSIYLNDKRLITKGNDESESILTSWFFDDLLSEESSYKVDNILPVSVYNKVMQFRQPVFVVNELDVFVMYYPIVVNESVVGVISLDFKKNFIVNLLKINKSDFTDTFILDSTYNIVTQSTKIDGNIFDENLYNDKNWQLIKNTPYKGVKNSMQFSDIINIEKNNYQIIKYYIKGDIVILSLWKVHAGVNLDNIVLKDTITRTSIVGIVSLIILGIVLQLAIHHVTSYISTTGIVASSLSKGTGDLTVRLPVKSIDEVGYLAHSFNGFLDKMQSIIGNIKVNAYTLTGNVQDMKSSINVSLNDFQSITEEFQNEIDRANKITGTSANAARVVFMQRTRFSAVNDTIRSLLDNVDIISDKMKSQSDAVSKTTSSIQQMMSNIVTVGQGANKANNYSKLLHTGAIESSVIGESVMESIQNIKEYSRQITSITRVIHNIAEQTNLLAMNAAIEAAHAGEKGRGFSVVADKIRKLAEDTDENSKIINEIIQQTRESVDYTADLSVKSTDAIEKIVEDAKKLATLISTISNANDELDIGRRDILNNVKNLNDITEDVQDLSNKQRQMSGAVSQNITNVDKLAEDVVIAVNTTEEEVHGLLSSIENVSDLSSTSVTNMERLDERAKELQTIFIKLYKLVTLFKTEHSDGNLVVTYNGKETKKQKQLEARKEKKRKKEMKKQAKKIKKSTMRMHE